jgi:hypothetical protein
LGPPCTGGGKSIRPQDQKFRQKEKFRGKIVTNRENVIIVLFVETPRKFITANLLLYVVFPQTKLLYVLSPCKHTKNLERMLPVL